MAELLARVSSRELSEWMAYEKLTGPLGGERADHHAALVSQTVANVNRRKKQKARKLSDFLLKWSKDVQTPEQQLSILKAWVRRQGGEVRRRGDDS